MTRIERIRSNVDASFYTTLDSLANAPSDLRYLLGLVEECREGMRHIAKLEGLWPPRATNTVYEPMQTYPLPAAKVAADWLEKVEGFKL